MENVEREYYEDGNICEERYYEDRYLHRIEYYENGNISVEKYCVNDLLHRIDGPAYIVYDEAGQVTKEFYFIEGICYEDIFQYLVIAGSY